jgi:hypothetical protein
MLRGSFRHQTALGALAAMTLMACGGRVGLPGPEILPKDPSPYPQIEVELAKPPRTGTPVFWRTDATNATKLLATTWDGRVVGSIQFTQPPTPVGPQSPDGSRLVVGSEIVSSTGQVAAFPVRYGNWADDNKCRLTRWRQVGPVSRWRSATIQIRAQAAELGGHPRARLV